MDIGVDIPKIALFIMLLVLSPQIECQTWRQPNTPMSPFPPIQPTPLCASQFALANHACARLPFNPISPPSPHHHLHDSPSANSDAPESSPTPSHRHRHSHHHHSPPESPVVQECCRWLQQIDSGCVCDLLVRLPIFLAKPGHQYTVKVDSSCTVMYSCPGRIISP
ncbi:hypothetical protein DCAR_0521058 [Daucus carota subsp. sativus]|uniref:Uncharacterized protein n=1 Tax=Daucus carota subsp. sativus TaxID=79200 RepID=A0A161YN25_DAUCS|nr:PREDICTED: uncharacterized protein LOC108220427 [Daucus carota subsp. sativus]WOH01673.1 hypothetical protein DCAR_0521058 [Daucus carota subsp. sativus]